MAERNPDWWQGATIYQIYPRSFQDTSGNGIGDLKGITRRLDHVAGLGVDAIWISPFVKSPMLDFGYDVSDYLAVDPMFGDLEDFQELLAAAHERGLKVMMDQVLSHTSNQHPWFLESREGRDNPKADWYVWADPSPTGNPPNNWLSVFGGPSWQWEPRRGQYYLHNFLREQPDLNYHCPEVQDAVLETCRFWLEMGVDGFRLDVCAFYFHDAKLRDNPPNPVKPEGKHFLFNPNSLQSHIHDISQPENLEFMRRLRALCDDYDDRALLGELHQSEGETLHREYTGPGRLQLAYSYHLLGAETITAATMRGVAAELGHEIGDGWPCWALDNHDFHRSVTRLGVEDRPDAATIILLALTCMRGATCVYQGNELALPNAEVPYDRIVDPYGREFYPAFVGRDGSRTPMPWDADQPHAGFSTTEPWLPIPGNHVELAVAGQERVPGSTLNRVKQFLTWRREIAPLRRGDMAFLDLPEPVLGFTRSLDGRTIVCLFNLGDEEVQVEIAPEAAGEPMHGHGFAAVREGARLAIPPHGAHFGERA